MTKTAMVVRPIAVKPTSKPPSFPGSRLGTHCLRGSVQFIASGRQSLPGSSAPLGGAGERDPGISSERSKDGWTGVL